MRNGVVVLGFLLAAEVAWAEPAPTTAGGGTIEGSVLRAGRPVAGVRVEIRRLFDLDDDMDGYGYRRLFERMLDGPQAWAPVATATTDASGRFAFPGLRPGVYDAETAGDGFFAATSVTLPLEGAHVEASLDLPSGTRVVRGRVVVTDGSAFTGRLLWATEAVRNEHWGMTVRGVPVTLGTDGRFSADCPAHEKVAFMAVEPGRRLVCTEFLEPTGDSPVLLAVDEGFQPLDVHAVEAATGAGLAGAVVLSKGVTSSGGFAMVRGVADDSGRCAVRGIGSSRGEVWAYVPGYEETGVKDVGGPGTRDVVVRMRRCARVEGRVLREDGHPVPGLAVHAAPARRRAVAWPHGHARTDADGRFSIEAAQAGDVRLYAQGPGWVTPGAGESEGKEPSPLTRTLVAGETTTVELRVVPAGVVRGRVVGATGAPVAGAVVRALTYTLDPRGWISFGEDPAVRAVAVTDRDGRFLLEGLEDGGRYSLRVTAVGALPEEVTGAASVLAPAPEIQIRLPASHAVDVLVLDGATDRPVEGARVEITVFPGRGRQRSYELSRWEGRTGADGHWLAGAILEEPMLVRAGADGSVTAQAWGHDAPPFEDRFTLRLGRPTTLSGHVYLPDGTPAAGQTVEFLTLAQAPFDARGRATADASGAFSFDGAAACDVVVKAEVSERGGAAAETKARGGDKDVVLRLRANHPAEWNAGGPALEVRVVDGEGSAVPAAEVVVHAPNDVVLREPLEDGVATVRGFPPGSPLTLEVEEPRDARGRRLPWARTVVAVAAGTKATTVRLQPGLSVEGHVTDAQGQPVAGVRLAAVAPGGLGAVASSGLDVLAITDAEGAFRVGGLEAGPCVLLSDPPPPWVAGAPLRTEAGARGVEVRLRASTTVRIRVLSAAGGPLPGAIVRFRPAEAGPRVVAATTDARGEAALAGVSPDVEGTLVAYAGQGSSTPLEHWKPRDAEVRVGLTLAEGRTDVVVHPDAPIEAGHNVLWCATSQLAWDALADAIARSYPASAPGGRLRLLPPAPPAAVERMNRRSFPHDAIDPEASVVVGGLARDGVADRIREAWRAVFGPDATPPTPSLTPLDAVGVAALARDLPFQQPFGLHGGPMAFGGGSPTVRAWGLQPYEMGPGAEAAAKQLTAYLPPGAEPSERPPATVVEIRPADARERIVLARLEPKATLEATWAAVAEILRTWRADSVEPGSTFAVPTIRLDAEQEFSEFLGAPLAGVENSYLRGFHERVRFVLSERGASIRAEAAVVLSLGIHPDLVFDKPFLVALRRADAPTPYFLLWVGNDALLERLVPAVGMPLDRESLEPYVGRWAIDPEASREASILRMFSLWSDADRAELGFPPGSRPSRAEILSRVKGRTGMGEEAYPWDVRLWVREDGHVVFEMGMREHGRKPDERQEGILELVEGKPVLRFPARAGERRSESGDSLLEFTLRDGRIEIPMTSEAWVLRHR